MGYFACAYIRVIIYTLTVRNSRIFLSFVLFFIGASYFGVAALVCCAVLVFELLLISVHSEHSNGSHSSVRIATQCLFFLSIPIRCVNRAHRMATTIAITATHLSMGQQHQQQQTMYALLLHLHMTYDYLN